MTTEEPGQIDEKRAHETADHVEVIVDGVRRLQSAAFDLFHEYYPEHTPDRQMLGAVAYLLYEHGAAAVTSWVVQTASRRIDFDSVVNYLFGIRRRVLAETTKGT